MRRKSIPRNVYQYLVVESRGLCNLCHDDIITEIHHIIPASRGGTSQYENLIPLCSSCHAKIHKTRYDPKGLAREKSKWAIEGTRVLSRVLRGAPNARIRIGRVLESFDAVESVDEFLGFRARLNKLLRQGEVFKNLFAVRRHTIRHVVSDRGDSKTAEVQWFSPFVRFPYRQLHLSGDRGATWSELEFKASARVRRTRIGVEISTPKDEPRFKSVQVTFEKPIEPRTPTELRWSFFWPNAWNLKEDRYTYDVLGWAEKVEFEMRFPRTIAVRSVAVSFVDVFGREWPRFGKCERLGAGFRWVGTRLPLFSSIVIQYRTRATS